VGYALVIFGRKTPVEDALERMMRINRMYAKVVQLLIANIWLKLNQDFALSAPSFLAYD
jgi:hypothetical protein